MQNQSPITVIIPAFGRPDSLAKAVASALAEINEGDTLVVVDDGSDPAVSLPPHAAIRIVRSERNRGAAAARNLGIANSQTPLIAFLDSDDEWIPGKLEAQRRLFGPGDPDPRLAVSCGWLDTRYGAAFRGRLPRPSARRADFFAGCWFGPGSTMLIAREAFAQAGPFAEDLPRLEDYEWFLRFALLGGRLDVVPIVGARIAAGRNARLPAVVKAVAAIAGRYSDDARLIADERRSMAAWLALNVALAGRNEGAWGQFVAALIRSFRLRPRTRIQLERWWREVPVPAEK